MYRYAVAVAVLVGFSSPAFADYFIIKDDNGCRVSDDARLVGSGAEAQLVVGNGPEAQLVVGNGPEAQIIPVIKIIGNGSPDRATAEKAMYATSACQGWEGPIETKR
jgi:hypothetical protein